jgi:hypothetical protein
MRVVRRPGEKKVSFQISAKNVEPHLRGSLVRINLPLRTLNHFSV